MTVVTVAACPEYEPAAVRHGLAECLGPLGGMAAYIRPGMRVLLKPNLLSAHAPERAITTHPCLVQAVAEAVQAAGGAVLIGDSPAGPSAGHAAAWRKSGLAEAARSVGATLVSFDEISWQRLDGQDYFLARPVLEADLIINLPKLKTHSLTLYSGAVKNLFGTVSGTRKREVHLRAPGVTDFSAALADVLELVRPGLTIMDGVWGLEGDGPGAGGTPRKYGLLAASADAVGLDAVMTGAMGYRPNEVRHLAIAGARGLGAVQAAAIRVVGPAQALAFGPVRRPGARWYLDVPAWLSAPVYRAARLRPKLAADKCTGCGRCAEVCPRGAITDGRPAHLSLERCVGCMCCAEVCPHAALAPRRNLLARLIGSA